MKIGTHLKSMWRCLQYGLWITSQKHLLTPVNYSSNYILHRDHANQVKDGNKQEQMFEAQLSAKINMHHRSIFEFETPYCNFIQATKWKCLFFLRTSNLGSDKTRSSNCLANMIVFLMYFCKFSKPYILKTIHSFNYLDIHTIHKSFV